jgi:hypothetical protein
MDKNNDTPGGYGGGWGWDPIPAQTGRILDRLGLSLSTSFGTRPQYAIFALSELQLTLCSRGG